MWAKLHMSNKRMLYTICFFVLCLIDQRIKTVSGLSGWSESFRDLTGVVMAVLILSHYRLSDLGNHRRSYLIWTLICVAGGAVFLIKGQPLIFFLNNRIVLTLGVLLLGFAVLRTFFSVFRERRKPCFNKGFSLAWLLMMAFMTVSRSGRLWPLVYLMIFGCFYLTDYTEAEQEDLFQGMLNGIILGFFLMQGWCFAFRPYDAVRYVGVYNNSNLNALFYLVVLAAVLAKLLYVYRAECGRWIKIYYWLGTGTVLGFLFMTISRTGWVSAIVLVIVALSALTIINGRRSCIKKFITGGLTVILCFCIALPLVFCAVRYLPPIFHHPVWFYGEWSENKVHSWDKWDSDKFINADKLLNTVSKRFAPIAETLFGTKNPGTEEAQAPIQVSPGSAEQGQQATSQSEVSPLQQQLYDEALEAGFAIDPADKKDAVLFRVAIYRYYAHLLNFRGHPDSEQGFQILPNQRIGHAHNIYLQWGVDFGIPAMLLFIGLMIYSAVNLLKRFYSEKSEQPAGYLLFLMVPAVFGLLEYCWGAGSLTITLLFVIWRRMICNETEQ